MPACMYAWMHVGKNAYMPACESVCMLVCMPVCKCMYVYMYAGMLAGLLSKPEGPGLPAAAAASAACLNLLMQYNADM